MGPDIADVGGDPEARRGKTISKQVREPGLVEWGITACQMRQLLPVAVEADDLVADARQAESSGQADVAEPDDAGLQLTAPSLAAIAARCYRVAAPPPDLR